MLQHSADSIFLYEFVPSHTAAAIFYCAGDPFQTTILTVWYYERCWLLALYLSRGSYLKVILPRGLCEISHGTRIHCVYREFPDMTSSLRRCESKLSRRSSLDVISISMSLHVKRLCSQNASSCTRGIASA